MNFGGPQGHGDRPGGPPRLTRREWAVAAGAAVLGGCGKTSAIEPSLVSIVRAPEYDGRIYQTVRGLLAEHQLQVRGRNVLLKPNLVEFEPQSAINTSVMDAAINSLRPLARCSMIRIYHFGNGF